MLKGQFQNFLINGICPNRLMFLQGDDDGCAAFYMPRHGAVCCCYGILYVMEEGVMETGSLTFPYMKLL